MSAGKIAELKIRRKKYVDKIYSTQNQIKKYERAHETLCTFKATVLQSQEDFNAINTNNIGFLTDIKNVKENNITVQRYHAGMKNIFSGVASGIIGVAYVVLIGTINLKLRNYMNDVDDYENNIVSYKNKISDLDRQISDEQKAEKLAKMMAGG